MKLISVVALAGALTVGLSQSAFAATLLVSGPSPFAGCTIGGPGTVYVNAEVEPRVAVNPTDSTNIIGVFQQDRWSNGGSNGLVAAVTHNGGTSWSTTWAHFSQCQGGNAANGGDWQRATDPWVTFSPNGVAYQISDS